MSYQPDKTFVELRQIALLECVRLAEGAGQRLMYWVRTVIDLRDVNDILRGMRPAVFTPENRGNVFSGGGKLAPILSVMPHSDHMHGQAWDLAVVEWGTPTSTQMIALFGNRGIRLVAAAQFVRDMQSQRSWMYVRDPLTTALAYQARAAMDDLFDEEK